MNTMQRIYDSKQIQMKRKRIAARQLRLITFLHFFDITLVLEIFVAIEDGENRIEDDK